MNYLYKMYIACAFEEKCDQLEIITSNLQHYTISSHFTAGGCTISTITAYLKRLLKTPRKP